MRHQLQNCSSSSLLHELLPTAQTRKTSFRAQLMTELKWHRWTKAFFFFFFFHKEICDLTANKQTYIYHIPKCEATKRHYSQKLITWAQTSLIESTQRKMRSEGICFDSSLLQKLFLSVVEEESLWNPGECLLLFHFNYPFLLKIRRNKKSNISSFQTPIFIGMVR